MQDRSRVVLLQAYDTSWRWEHREINGAIGAASRRAFRTLEECIDDAQIHGYGNQAGVPARFPQ